MVCFMATVIENDVEWSKLAAHFRQEIWISLAANPDVNILIRYFMSLAGLAKCFI